MKDGKCSGINKDGSPCNAQAWRDQLCRWHHPDLEEKRAEGRRKGGQNRSTSARARKAMTGDLRDLASVKARMMSAFDRVESGDLEPNVGATLATMARAIAAISGAADFEGQLADLRHEVAALAERRGA